MTTETEHTEALRKEVRKLMIDRGVEYGSLHIMADALTERTGRRVSRQNVCFALTGYRQTKAYHRMLLDLKAILEVWPPDKAA